MAGGAPQITYNVSKWIEENKKFFLPPVCNKMMHGAGQLKVFYVGGPNIRKDFHLEEGEELFYQVTGDMNLVTLTKGGFKDVKIKEGEVFLLPGMIPHSPQRYKDTVGLVIERQRLKAELDCLRYFVSDTTDTLWEKWFYCEDLGTQLGPVIKEYFASEQHKTGKPVPGTITTTPPWVPDTQRSLEEPFRLSTWLNKHKAEIEQEGSRRLFNLNYQSDISIIGSGNKQEIRRPGVETWLYQVEGSSKVTVKGKDQPMNPKDSMLIKVDTSYKLEPSEGGFVMQVVMDPAFKSRAFTHLSKK